LELGFGVLNLLPGLGAHSALTHDGQPALMAEMAMRATYAIIEDTALFVPDKLINTQYVDELKNQIARHIFVARL